MHRQALIRSKIKLNPNVSLSIKPSHWLKFLISYWLKFRLNEHQYENIHLGYGWITKELSNISDGKMVVCFGDYTKPDGLVDDYSIKSTLNSIKSLIYRLDTPYMNNKAKSSQQLYDAIRPVIETQG